ncbi:ATP synthase subunit 4 [Neoconidiobolus thromboides FSU 785]|nr:ATP synthase subunit 4 [Neoconidiobolus thromboides FSU 785]
MASKFAISSLSTVSRTVAAKSLRTSVCNQIVRNSSSTPEVKQVDPKTKATSLIDSLPGNNIVSKAGFVTIGATLSTWLISKEIYVVNEETVVAASFLAIVALILKNAKAPYNEWAENRLNFIKNLLVEARQNHKEQVKERIESATQLSDIVPVTKDLFTMSKELASMQSKIFELKQQVQVNSEIKSTLDSWVRYENAVREQEQKAVAAQVLENVQKSIKDPKIQAQLLKEAIADAQKLIAKA